MKKNLASTVVNLILLFAGAILLISAQGIQPGTVLGQGADFMPKLLTIVWVALGALLVWTGLKEPEQKKQEGSVRGFLLTLALLFIYIFLLKPIGFTLASIFYIFAQMLLFAPKKDRTPKKYILFAVIAIVIPVCVNLIFANVFSLILPEGLLFK